MFNDLYTSNSHNIFISDIQNTNFSSQPIYQMITYLRFIFITQTFIHRYCEDPGFIPVQCMWGGWSIWRNWDTSSSVYFFISTDNCPSNNTPCSYYFFYNRQNGLYTLAVSLKKQPQNSVPPTLCIYWLCSSPRNMSCRSSRSFQ
jgi:hypothetical protein